MSKGLIIGIVVTFSLIIGAWAISPKTFSSNEELIGKGTPVILVIFDNRDSVSKNLKYGYKILHETYGDRIEFMLINILSPNGINFMQHTSIEAGIALYYNAEGEQILKLTGPKSVADLDESIKSAFDF